MTTKEFDFNRFMDLLSKHRKHMIASGFPQGSFPEDTINAVVNAYNEGQAFDDIEEGGFNRVMGGFDGSPYDAALIVLAFARGAEEAFKHVLRNM